MVSNLGLAYAEADRFPMFEPRAWRPYRLRHLDHRCNIVGEWHHSGVEGDPLRFPMGFHMDAPNKSWFAKLAVQLMRDDSRF